MVLRSQGVTAPSRDCSNESDANQAADSSGRWVYLWSNASPLLPQTTAEVLSRSRGSSESNSLLFPYVHKSHASIWMLAWIDGAVFCPSRWVRF
ncbi:hypothetical protein [Alkaliphilus metalliredigens]|uniref:hypothetical protein n=1 Tax=Alkaliphilus metalliredigens TaxID=208226 RepID=UPI00059F8AE7|nr:hypothetical protein [Alkaliphilus metalliredigens]